MLVRQAPFLFLMASALLIASIAGAETEAPSTEAEQSAQTKSEATTMTEYIPDGWTPLELRAFHAMNQGDTAEGERLYREALAQRRNTLGDDHPHTIFTILNLASIVLGNANFDEAEKLHREALNSARRALPEDHPLIFDATNAMGVMLSFQEKHAQAEEHYRTALEGRRRILPKNHHHIQQSLVCLVRALADQDRHAEAEPYARESWDLAMQNYGDDSPYTHMAASELAEILIEAGNRLDEALLLTQHSLDRSRQIFGEHDFRLGMSYAAHARALLAHDRYEEAEEALNRAHTIVLEALGPQDPRTIGIVEHHIDLYRRWHEADPTGGHQKSAAEWRTKLAASRPDPTP